MILLIGASSGIGKKILPKLLKIDNVIATFNKTKIPNIPTNKHKLIKLKLDVSSEKSILFFIKKNKSKLKNIICINLSAITLDRLIIDIKKKELFDVFSTNIFCNFYLVKHLVPLMIKEKFGRFIFFSSSKAEKGDIGISAYSASKISLHGLSKSIVNEYSRFGITSNIISLGYFNTKLWERLSEKKKRHLVNEIPSKRLGNISDISNIILPIIKTSFLNGSTIKVDGGI